MPFRKTCKVCGKSKPAPGFARNSDNPDGLRDVCKRCNSKAAGKPRSRNGKVISRGVRNEVKERANGRCEICGKQSNLELHHVQPVCLHPELRNNSSNLKALCPACHKAEHQKPGMDHFSLARKREALRPRHIKEVRNV